MSTVFHSQKGENGTSISQERLLTPWSDPKTTYPPISVLFISSHEDLGSFPLVQSSKLLLMFLMHVMCMYKIRKKVIPAT